MISSSYQVSYWWTRIFSFSVVGFAKSKSKSSFSLLFVILWQFDLILLSIGRSMKCSLFCVIRLFLLFTVTMLSLRSQSTLKKLKILKATFCWFSAKIKEKCVFFKLKCCFSMTFRANSVCLHFLPKPLLKKNPKNLFLFTSKEEM